MPAIEILENLFGSQAKVKILRLFLFHPHEAFDSAMIREKTKLKAGTVRKIMNTLEKIKIVKKKAFTKEGKVRKIKAKGWVLDPTFEYIAPLRTMLIGMNPMKYNDVHERFKNFGKMKLIIVAGVFIQEQESRVDLLIVGDKMKNASIERAVSVLEAEIGKDLRYVLLETEEFLYRRGMYDKLIRDIVDFPHEIVIDKIGMSTANPQ